MNIKLNKLFGLILLSLSAGALATDSVPTPANGPIALSMSENISLQDEDARARAIADEKVVKLKAAIEARTRASHAKPEVKANPLAGMDEKLQIKHQSAAEAKAAKLAVNKEADAEADKLRAEHAALAPETVKADPLPLSDADKEALKVAQEAKEREIADAKVAKLKAAIDAKNEAARIKSEQKAKAEADAQAKADALAQAKAQAAADKSAKLKAEQDAKAERLRIKAEKTAQAAAAAQAHQNELAATKLKAEQDAAANAAVVQAANEAKQREIADAKVAKLKAEIEAKNEAARLKSEQKAKADAEAHARTEALAEARAHAAAEKAAKLKAEQDAKIEADRVQAEQSAQAAAAAQAHQNELAAAKLKAEQDAAANAAVIQAANEAKQREIADARIAKLKADMEAKNEAARLKSEQKAKADAEAHARAEALAQARAEAAADKAAKLKAAQDAKLEADRAKAEQEAQATADAHARTEALAQAKAQAASDKAAKLKAEQNAKAEADRAKKEQQTKLAEEKAAKLKAEQDAKIEAERLMAEQQAQALSEQQAKDETEAAAAAQKEAARVQAETEAQAKINAIASKAEKWETIAKRLSSNGVQLVMNPKDAEHLFHKDPMDESSFPVKFQDGDITLNGRVTVKGSFTRNFLKKSLIVKFDKGVTWHGQDRVSLDAMATDVTETHQWLAHDLMSRMKMAAPEMLFTNLDINGKRVGRYLMVEWIKPAMFERFGLGRDGELYHPDDIYFCGGFQPEDMKRIEKCFFRLDGGKDYTHLKQLAQDLDTVPVEKFDEFMDKHFDGDSVINWLVLNTLAGSEDTYNKNFFLYYSNVTGKWTVVPWDYDMAFGRVADLGAAYPRTIFNSGFQYLHSPESGAPSPLKEKTLKNDKLYKRYLAKIKELFADTDMKPGSIKGWYNPKNFSRVLEQNRDATYAGISTEMYPNQDRNDFGNLYDAMRFFNEWRYQYLNKLMLVPSIWNTPIWLPYKSFDPLEERAPDFYNKRQIEPLDLVASKDIKESGKKVFFVDPMLGIPLTSISVISLSKPSRFDVHVSFQQTPPAVPDNINSGACLERSWHINNRTPNSQVMANLEIDYLNESSTRHEIGPKIKSESSLAIWSQLNGEWQVLNSTVNPRSNSFVVSDVALGTGEHTLVACVTDKTAVKKATATPLQAQPAVEVKPLVQTDEEKSAKLKAEQEAKAEAARVKAEQKVRADEARAAKLKSEQEAKAEATRLKADQQARAAEDAAKRKAEQDAIAAQHKADQTALQPAPTAPAVAADDAAALADKEAQEREIADAKVAKLKAKIEAAAKLKAAKTTTPP